MELAESVSAPVEAGQKLGPLVIRSGGQKLAQRHIVAANAVEKLTWWQITVRLLGEVLGALEEGTSVADADRALAAGPMRPQELAERTGTAPRYVEEWLRGQAAGASGVTVVDEPPERLPVALTDPGTEAEASVA